MSSNDQQYPYGPAQGQGQRQAQARVPAADQGYGYGPGHDGTASGQQPQQPLHPARPHDPHAYGDGATGAQPYPPQSYGNQSYGDQPYGGGGQPQPSYGGQSYGDQVYGGGANPHHQPQPHQPYDDQSYGDQSYGNQVYGGGAQPHQQPQANQSHGGQPYRDQPHGAPVQGHGHGHAPYGHGPGHGQAPATHAGAGWPAAAGHTQEPAAPAAPAPGPHSTHDPNPQVPQEPHIPYDPAVTQTWEGQTWDTQYQPTIRPTGSTGPVGPTGPAQPETSVRESVPPAAETAYLPPYSAYSQTGPQGATRSRPLPPEAPAAPAPAPVSGAAPGGGPAASGSPATTASGLDTSEYGAPTTLGNSRVTDAQRARAEGRSPIIPPGIQPAGITAVLGLLLALGAAIGSYALLVPLVLLQAVTAAGWFRLNGMWPARQGIALAFAGGVVADVALLAAGRENAPAAVLGTLGVWVLLTVVLQLRSQADPDERMYGLMATTASAALTVLAAGHLAAVPDMVTAGTVAVAAAVLVRALPLPGPASVVVALLAGAGAGAAAGALVGFGGAHGAVVGLAAGGCALIGLRAASYDYPSRFVHMTAGVALPLTAAAPAVYLVGQVLA